MAGNNNEITTVFKADISQYQDSIKGLNRYIQTVNQEFRNATKGSSDWSKSSDGLKAKLTQLNRTLMAQEQVLAELEKEYNSIDQSQEENKESAQKLYAEINKVRANISKTKKDIDKYNKSLDEMENESDDSVQSLKDLEDQQQRINDGFTVAKGAIAGFIANGLTALAGAAKNAVTSMLGLADATREYRQTLATLETAAGDVGVSTDFIKDKFADMMGVFNDEASVTEGLNNLLTAGFDESSLDSITQALEGASLKWKDTLKFEGLSDSLQEWIGSGGENLTGNFAELLERMGYNLEEVQAKTKGMTDEQRRNYATNLLASEGLNEVSEAYREQNKDMVDAQTANIEYQNTVASMGERIEPITTKIREGFTRILDKILELLEGVDMEAFAATIEDAFDYFINTIIPAIVSGLQWILDNKDIILAGIIAIGSAFLAWKAVGVITSVVNAIKDMSAAFKILNTVMKANPIGIVVSLLAALVSAFIYLWNNCEGFRKFWQDLWKGIQDTVKSVVDWLSDAFTNAYNSIKDTFGKLGQWFKDLWDDIIETFKSVGTKIGDAIGSAFKTAINAALAVVEGAINFVPNAINGALDILNKIPNVNIPKMSTISLPRLAKGGIVDKATLAQIGEAGQEAIVPLERNTQGLKKMAGMVAGELKQAGLGNVNVTYNQTYANMPTTRYAMKKAVKDINSSWMLIQSLQGGM